MVESELGCMVVFESGWIWLKISQKCVQNDQKWLKIVKKYLKMVNSRSETCYDFK